MANPVRKKGQVVIEHNRSLKGILAKYVKSSLPPEEWQEVREKAWAEAVAEDWKRESEDG